MLSLVFAQVLVVTGASLVTGTPGGPGPGAAPPDPRPVTLVVEAGKVREILPAESAPAELPAEARVLDGTGLFLCAAPLDGFAYWDEAHDPLYASAGVALVADHGNRVLSIFDARANSARVGYPDLRICGPVIDGFPPSTTDASVARTPLEAEAQLRPLLEEGIDFVAFQANLTAEPWRKLLEVAHGASRQVWGPRPRGLSLADAVAGGQDGFLMMDVLLEPGATWEGRRAEEFDAGIQKLGAARARLVPLLSGNARLLERWTAELPELENLSPEFASYWRSELSARSTLFADPAARAEFQAKGAKAMELQRELLLRLHRAGVRLVPGSGAPHPWLFPGRGLHDELAQWQAAGLDPAVLVHLATAGAAEALGVAELRGSLSPGKQADFLLLRENPCLNIAALRAPEWVVLRGQARSRAELDLDVQSLRRRMARAREAAARPIDVGDPPRVEGELVLAGYCESQALGVRSAAERYTVVRGADGKLSFCGLRVVPQEDGSRIEIESLQRLVGRELEYFSTKVRSAKHELSVEGFWTANQFRVQRRLDGGHLDITSTMDHVVAVDAGSVTTALVLGATQDGGRFPVMLFHETLQLEVVRWELTVEADGAHFLRTPEGVKWMRFDERGAVLELSEQRGSSGVRTVGTNTLAKNRPGLPFSEAKNSVIQRAKAALEAARKDAKHEAAPPASSPGSSPGGSQGGSQGKPQGTPPGTEGERPTGGGGGR